MSETNDKTIKTESPKVEEVKTESPKVEDVKTEAPKAEATKQVVADKKPATNNGPANRNARGNDRRGQRGNRRNNNRRNGRRQTDFEERVVDIARVVNVVKGGRRFSFSTLVVIGDKKGRVAYGHGKAKEVPDSIKKAIKDARRNLIKTPVVKGTVPHITQAKYISSQILLKPAPKGKGIIASGAVRAVVELAGYTDIVTKSLGSNNKTNTVKATLKALSQLRTAEEISALRGKDVTQS